MGQSSPSSGTMLIANVFVVVLIANVFVVVSPEYVQFTLC
jgi:hypothetical protein